MRISLEVVKRKCFYQQIIRENHFLICRFMIEFIKRRQDEELNKDVIRIRNLGQSMLRFTRIYQDVGGEYHRDTISEEYSCIMTESKKNEE